MHERYLASTRSSAEAAGLDWLSLPSLDPLRTSMAAQPLFVGTLLLEAQVFDARCNR
jgi:hypothetical protein